MNTFKHRIFPVTGMSCAGCAANVERVAGQQKGIAKAVVNFADSSLSIDYNPEIITPEQLRAAIQAVGYDLIIEQDDSAAEALKKQAHETYYRQLKRRTTGAIILSVPLIIIGMFFMHMPYSNYITWILATPVLFVFGRQFYKNAWKQIRHNTLGMDTLVALSTGVAYLFSVFNTLFPKFWHEKGLESHVYFEAAGVIITFVLLGRLLEEKAKNNTSSAIKKLMGLQPKTVTKIVDGKETVIPISQVIPGDYLVVKPGAVIPVDGVVSEGYSFVDESMISGEAIPVEKQTGAGAYAGTINQQGSFILQAQKVGGDTILSQIVQLVRKAQGSKAPVQRLVDKIARIFVPSVIGIALITFMLWMIFGGEHAFTHALLTSITVLVIACPCALGLATPTAIMVGIGKGAENHILIKDAESLETAYKINTVVLDKTGTITEGKPRVNEILWNHKDERINEFSSILYAIESKSEHPIAQAIAGYLSSKQCQTVPVEQFENIAGGGVEALYNQQRYSVGNVVLMKTKEVHIPFSLLRRAEQWQADANTVVWFAREKETLAIIAVADKIKASSVEAIETLQNRGIEVCMLTGDNPHTAAAVARLTRITNFQAQTLPADKAVVVQQFQHEGKIVGMVGDGINDSQALAQADIGFAMGKGSDIAMDVAQITLITSDLNALPKTMSLSQKTVRIIRQNLFWAFIYNVIGIPLAAGVLFPSTGFLLNPMIAGAAMALSSVSVVTNSLRLKWGKL